MALYWNNTINQDKIVEIWQTDCVSSSDSVWSSWVFGLGSYLQCNTWSLKQHFNASLENLINNYSTEVA